MKITQYVLPALAAVVLALTAFAAQATPTTSYYVYDESGHVIGEYDANGNPVQEHIYLGDRPVAVVQNNTVDYVTTDQLNTPRAVTDSSQNVEWNWSSDPFGNGTPTGSLTYNLRFPGQYYDQETGLNYNYTRDYDTSSGRYIESDLNGLKGGINTYAYVFENPLELSDIRGLAPTIAENGGTKSLLETIPDLKCYIWFGSCVSEIFLCIQAECEYHDCKGHSWTLTITEWLSQDGGLFPPADEVQKLSPNCHCTVRMLKKRGNETEGLQ